MADDKALRPSDGQVQLKLSWVDFEETAVVSANQFVSQFMEEGLFILSFGMVTPPVLLGTPEEKKKQAEAMGFLPVNTLSRVGLTPAGMRKLIYVLQTNLEKYEDRFRVKE